MKTCHGSRIIAKHISSLGFDTSDKEELRRRRCREKGEMNCDEMAKQVVSHLITGSLVVRSEFQSTPVSVGVR